MIVLALTLVALLLAVGWAVDAHYLRSEARKDYGRLDDRVGELSEQLLNARRRGLGLPPRPVVRWHEEIERRITPKNQNPGGI